MPETATTIAMRDTLTINKRRMRAEQLVAGILSKLDDILVHEQREDAYYALMGLFMDEGWDVVTDYHRREVGLPPRNAEGWTAQELTALEMKRLELLLAPIQIPPLWTTPDGKA